MLMAEVKTGKIVKKLTGPVSQSHIDDFNYIESAGSWSPDGNQYVVTSFSGGRNIMLLIKLDGNRITEKEIRFKDIQSFNNPEWSPDGKKIVFSGLVKGLSDLFLYDIEKDEVEKITHDFYSDLQPSWSSDGQHIVFISDRGPDTDFSRQLFGNYRLSIYDMATDSITVIQDVFPASEVFSPYYIRQDSSLLFLSHADGFRNLYRYDLYTDSLFRMTRFPTGIAGITDLAPAFSVSCQTQELVYTLYHHDGYHLYKASLDDFEYEPVSKNMLNTRPEHLPPVDRVMNVVEQNLHKHPQTGDSSMTLLPYKPKLELEYIGSGGFGVATGAYDTYASGGVNALFGDVLKRHELYTLFMLQGELYDAGGGATYINREQRFNWGLSLFHIPYRYAYYNYDPNIFYDGDPYDSITIVQQRIFQDQLAFFGQYPFSKKIRIEAGGYLTRYSYRVDSITDMYYWGAYTGQVKRRGDAPDADFIPKIYTAFVGDDVDFGVTCPLDGYRFRLQIDHSFADLRQFTTLVDLRRYKYFKPFSAGLRLLHYARYGRDANKLYPMYLGNNYFIRGYAYSSFADNYLVTEDSFNPNSIMGSRMALFNAELRLPFTGPERLAMIKSGYLFSDLVLFADGGFSTYSYSEIDWGWNANPEKYNVVYSAGLAMRINLFGYAIIEPYVARPFQRTDKEYVFGLFLKGMDW